MVGDLVSLLRNCKQPVEPNLQALEEEYNAAKESFTFDAEDDAAVTSRGGDTEE
jgi:hypothetical protein